MNNLITAAYQLGLMLKPGMMGHFQMYRDMLQYRGRSLGLVGTDSSDELEVQHLVDSLTLTIVIRNLNELSVVDVGTGAGLPGIPLKIAYPPLRITLLDSRRRSCSFLKSVVNRLGLENVVIIRSRAEDYGRLPEGREKHDLAVSRAVAGIAETLEYTLPLVRPGGQVALYRGDVSELDRTRVDRVAQALGGRLKETIPVRLGGLFKNRSLLMFLKTEATPVRYPRRAGIPGKRPLVPGLSR